MSGPLFLTGGLRAVDGYSALMAGVAFLPLVGGMFAGAWLAAENPRLFPYLGDDAAIYRP